jgi:L-ascorbate oxidase
MQMLSAFAALLFITPLPLVSQTRTLSDPAESSSIRTGPHDVSVILTARYSDFTIFNPETNRNDPVHLRGYNGMPVGPTIRVYPGDTLHVTLRNQLPSNDPSCSQIPDHNIPHCFNSTNLHTHGLHVSPSGASDNVLLEIAPGKSQEYAFVIPQNHPAGTFWYHPHLHGSTALQLSSGMEGALIVKGVRSYGDKNKVGRADIDTVLKQARGKRITERVALFQQVQYSCRDAQGALTWDCADPNDTRTVGGIEQYTGGQFGPKSWTQSGRYTTINGLVQPNVPVHAGEVYRWRLIHGGVRDTIALRITRSVLKVDSATTQAVVTGGIAGVHQSDWANSNCVLNDTISQFEIATDGLTRRTIVEKTTNIMQPGYRSDVLTVFPDQGVYCVIDDALDAGSKINSAPIAGPPNSVPVKDRRVLALIIARGQPKAKILDSKAFIGEQLFEGNTDLPDGVRNSLRRLDISEFTAYEDLSPSTSSAHQQLLFDIRSPPAQPSVPQPAAQFDVNGKPYDPNRIDRLLLLRGTEDWDLGSSFDNHPFHIHVNPFQVIQITKPKLDPQGNTILDASGQAVMESIINGEGACNELDLPTPDPQYCDAIGTFRDTLLVKRGYRVTIRTRYDDFTGDFVLHCHILDHEDQGMMQNVRIQDPAHPSTEPFGGLGSTTGGRGRAHSP